MKKIINNKVETLGRLLILKGWRITCAESCTGGGIAQAFTAVAGSSDWFDLGVVTYSNSMKSKILGVQQVTLAAHGAVSAQVVREMADGALTLSGADLAVAVSGVAGPGGGSRDKPVGTVYAAWGVRGQLNDERWQFSGDRASVREQSINACLDRLIAFLQNFNKNTV